MNAVVLEEYAAFIFWVKVSRLRVQTVLKDGGQSYPEKGRRDRKLVLAYRNREQKL
jgi:hypothetical protein